jgi:hypothetical protein
MRRKGFLVALCVILSIIFVVSPALAASSPMTMDGLTSKYHLQSINSLPAGKLAIKFDTVAQADKFLTGLQAGRPDFTGLHVSNGQLISDIMKEAPAASPDSISAPTATPMVSATASYPYGTQDHKVMFGAGGYLNLQVGYSYYYSASLRRNLFYNLLKTETYLSGFDPFWTWTPTGNPYGYAYNKGLDLYDQQSGVIDYYLLINGLVRLFSQHYTISWTFTNP